MKRRVVLVETVEDLGGKKIRREWKFVEQGWRNVFSVNISNVSERIPNTKDAIDFPVEP